MTIKTSLYGTENVWNLIEKDLISGLSVKTAIKSKNRIFQIKDGGGLLWSKPSSEIPHLKCWRSHCLKQMTTGKRRSGFWNYSESKYF